MSSERADQPAPLAIPQGIPGHTLATQREALGWSVEQVADQLKLAVRQVIALEAGDYASLPSPAVTRGFVRAYAKLMKLDPVPLVAQIAMDTPTPVDTSAATAARRPTPASFSAAKFPSHGKRFRVPLGVIAGAVAIAVAVGGAWHFGLLPMHRGDTAATVAAPAAAGTTPETVNGSAVETLQNPAVPLISVPGASASASASAPAAAVAAAPTAVAAGPVVNVPATTATGAPPSAVPAPAATPPATQAAPAVAAAAAAAQPAGANALVLAVRQDSWIEVRPARGGAPLISRLVKAGSTETVNVDGPVRMLVGNPGGVSATLRGAAVALPAVPGKTISRVNLQ
jgi:cytoskeleton protein RodZ